MPSDRMAVTYVRKFFPSVNRVVDAVEPLEVSVAGEDVLRSKQKDPRECAMARACRREYDIDGALVSTSVAYMIRGDTAIRYIVPESLRSEVIAFDRSGEFTPESYYLRNPSPGHSLGYRRSPHAGNGKKLGKKRAPQVHPHGVRTGIKFGPRQ